MAILCGVTQCELYVAFYGITIKKKKKSRAVALQDFMHVHHQQKQNICHLYANMHHLFRSTEQYFGIVIA